MAGDERDEWVDRALATLSAYGAHVGAFVWSEAEARLADTRWTLASTRIDPHHLTTAKRMLVETGILRPEVDITKGGHQIEVFHHLESRISARERLRVATRKRALMARFLGWAIGTNRHPRGLIGPAAETAVQAALEQAGSAGYRVVDPGTRGVVELLGNPVPRGPLDNAAHLILLDSSGTPLGAGVVAVEVKNIRDWIYPNSAELYQLLDKCAQLQLAHPARSFVPVLVCRRAHYTAYKMAKDLGFYIIQARRQFLVPSADLDPAHVGEVRDELGLADLVLSDQPDLSLVRQFRDHLPKAALRTAEHWARSGPALAEQLAALRKPGMDPRDRSALLTHLRESALRIAEHDDPGGW